MYISTAALIKCTYEAADSTVQFNSDLDQSYIVVGALSAEAGPGGEAAALNTADPGSWTIQRVVQYFSETTDCKEFATVCEKQEIDGSALLTLTAETLVKCLDIKLGPATKIVRHVEKLRPKS